MKNVTVSFSVLCAVVLSGCAGTQSLQSPDALLARDILTKHCIVGIKPMGMNTVHLPVREGVVSKHNDANIVHYKHKIRPNQVTVYSVKDLTNDWVIVDASTQRVRDNMYFNRATGEFACSTSEWRYSGGAPVERTFETTPLITFSGK